MQQFLHSLIPDKDTIVISVIALGYGLFAFFALLLLAEHNAKVESLKQNAVTNVGTDLTKEKLTLITIKTATYTMYDCGDVYIALAIDSGSFEEKRDYLRGMPQCKKIK